MSLTERAEESEGAGERQERQVAREGQVAPRPLRVMTYNILSGGWPRVNALEKVMRAARADIIGMQEVSPRTLDELANRLGMFSALAPAASGHGSPAGLLSRWPPRAVNLHPEAPMRNALLEAVVAPGGMAEGDPAGMAEGAAPLRIFVTHLAASYSAWRGGEGERLRELAYILGQMGKQTGEPRLLMGDFNSLPPGERLLASRLLLHAARNDARRAQGDDLTGQPGIKKVLPRPLRPLASALLGAARLPALAWLCDQTVSAYVPRAVVRQTRAAGYTDLYTLAHPDPRQREMSCPAQNPAGRIDYIFASPTLAAGLLTCDLLGEADASAVLDASDHLPMLATLALPPAQQ